MSTGRDYDFDDCPGIGICQAQTAAKLGNSLPHSADADSDALRTQLNYLLFDSFPVIAHGNHNAPFFFDHANAAIVRPGVPKHVGEGFLHDAEDCGLQF